MSASNFNTRNDTFRKLMGNGLTYRIPRFQRDYSWSEDEWEDLWADILGTVKEGGEPAHYMGYLVLQSEDEKTFDVIDGQQRMTTLSIIVLAAMKNLEKLVQGGKDAAESRQRMETLRQTYIGYLDPVTLVARSKLSLNRHNDNYYQNYLIPLARLPQRNLRASEHLLRKAFEWFEERVEAHVRIAADQSQAIAQLVENMSDRLFFTVICVTDELNAYKVFETLNARGVRLSATDLLKNYLFSVLHRAGRHEHEMKSLEDRWENMVGRLGSESFPDFLRMHWNSRHPFVRQTELFKTIRGEVGDPEILFALIREMDEDIDTYLALTQPETSTWPADQKQNANELHMFNVKQPYPLLMAARRRMSDGDFGALLQGCAVISFRYNVIGNQPTSEQERVYNAVAGRISKGEVNTAREAIAGMHSIYPGDDAFRAAFSDKVTKTTQTRNRRVVRYILCRIEKQASGNECDFDSPTFNIEHVLPQSPESGWDSFTDEEKEALAYRLGNMTLLKTSENKDLANASYEVKREVYTQSGFELTKRIAQENAEWNAERVATRQQWMAKQATGIWKIHKLA